MSSNSDRKGVISIPKHDVTSSSSAPSDSSIIHNQRWIIANQPNGKFNSKRDLELINECINLDEIQLEPNEFIVQTQVFAVDAFVRTLIDTTTTRNHHGDGRTTGSNVVANGYGTVIKCGSNSAYKIGQYVVGVMPVAKLAICPKNRFVKPMMLLPGQTSKSSALTIMGMPGMSAYFGLFHAATVGPKKSDTIVVSAGCGSVGCIVIQIAKLTGVKRVVGIAGGQHKKQWLIEELKCDAAIDYKDPTQSLSDQLDKACPDGIDFYFDNVGGPMLDVVLDKINQNARVVICGATSQYDTGTYHSGNNDVYGPSNYIKLAERNASMSGFSIMNYMSGSGAIWNILCFVCFMWWNYVVKRNVKDYKHVEHGIESFGNGIEMLFNGSPHVGKILIDVDGSLASSSTGEKEMTKQKNH